MPRQIVHSAALFVQFLTTLDTHHLDPVCGEPVEDFEEEERDEEYDEGGIELFPEYGEGEEALGHRVPRSLV